MARFDIVSKDRSVETDLLVVEDNIMRWSNTIIQISNIAFITSVKAQTTRFPILSLLPLSLGIYLIASDSPVGWALAIAATIWIVVWAVNKDKEDKRSILRISLNSGMTYNILFHDKKFLHEVMKQLAGLISKPFSQKNLTINVKDSTFNANSSVIRNTNS